MFKCYRPHGFSILASFNLSKACPGNSSPDVFTLRYEHTLCSERFSPTREKPEDQEFTRLLEGDKRGQFVWLLAEYCFLRKFSQGRESIHMDRLQLDSCSCTVCVQTVGYFRFKRKLHIQINVLLRECILPKQSWQVVLGLRLNDWIKPSVIASRPKHRVKALKQLLGRFYSGSVRPQHKIRSSVYMDVRG